MIKKLLKILLLITLSSLISFTLWAESEKRAEGVTTLPQITAVNTPVNTRNETLSTLLSFVELQDQLRRDITDLRKSLKSATTNTEKSDIKELLEKAEKKLKGTTINIENIAADTDLSLLRVSKARPFNLQKELFSLIEPALKEMKHATSDVRLKSNLREKIVYYQQREPIARQALKNIATLNKANQNPKIKSALVKMNKNWSKQLVFIESEIQAKELQLIKLESQEESFTQKSESYFKEFFQRRGWTLIQALFSIIGVLIFSRIVHNLFTRFIKGYRAEKRGVQLRVIDILHRFFTFLLVIIAPMIIFYIEEDWVLFSLGILFLIAFAWTLRLAIPRYWGQLELFLNVGPVREGERIELNGIPWQVKNINMYSILENPVAGLTQRVDIDDLVDLRSRPVGISEPWFPCKRGDWVHLSDGMRGKVTGISLEFIQFIQRGGASTTYLMADFLALSPRNVSKSFRVKETFGISYAHQIKSTNDIVDILQKYIMERIADEGYKDDLQSLRVEFESAADSSLNLVVVADFKGSVADIYMRLRRAIQRWCVDASTENGWDIPYPQLTIHAENIASTR